MMVQKCVVGSVLTQAQLFFVLCITWCCIYGVRGSWFLDSLYLSAVGVGSANKPVHRVCSVVPGLVPKQRRLCQTYPRVMFSMSEGAKLGLMECVHQFKNDRWNCSAIQSDSTDLKKVLEKSTKETAFLYAISSAGAVHAVTRSCSAGHLQICECDPSKRGEGWDEQGKFTWGGCSDHIRFGMRMTRAFMDAKDRRNKADIRSLMNLHNNKAGRRIIWSHRDRKCKCHGVSGACSMRTCWQRMMDFRTIGKLIKKGYDESQRVFYDSSVPGNLITDEGRRPGRKRLAHLEISPNFCEYDLTMGHPGVGGRECNSDKDSEDSCDKLCCGRGFHTTHQNVTEECDCKFYWCCEVRCKTCTITKITHTCKPHEADNELNEFEVSSPTSQLLLV